MPAPVCSNLDVARSSRLHYFLRAFAPSRAIHPRSQRGAALVLVLAFVVLLTGLVMAFLANSLNNRKIAGSSVNQTKVELFAQGALDTIVGDLKQEIADGSTNSRYTNGAVITKIYTPLAPTNAAPSLVGSTGTNGLENLVKRSVRGQALNPGGTSHIAVADSSTNTSKNGRSISPARWNKPLLMAATSTNNLTPLTADPFTPPDWILVARDGTNPTGGALSDDMKYSSSNATTVVARYAYAVYDEGGLLDVNVAGYPLSGTPPYSSSNSDPTSSYKSVLAFADLTQLPGIGNMTAANQQTFINNLVGWRNYASARPDGTSLGNLTFASASSLTNYTGAVLSNTTGFLTTGNKALFNNQSDRMFTSRQQLLNFVLQGLGFTDGTDIQNLQTALQYMGTFSRDVNQPSYAPDPLRPTIVSDAGNLTWPIDYKGGSNAGGAGADDLINPSFLSVRCTSAFTRNDGSLAAVGEPLAKNRFALSKLAWLTYQGPSGDNNRTLTGNSTTGPDADITLLKNSGIGREFLQRGTAQTIFDTFGLSWITDNGVKKWVYNHSGTAPLAVVSGATTIKALSQVAALTPAREPDFVELLKAAICAGSKGKSACSCRLGSIQSPPEAGVWQHKYDTILDLQIIQIAANIIDQFDGDGYPTLIYFNPGLAAGLTPPTVAGVENLPYLIGERIITRKIIPPTFAGNLTDPITNPGVGAAFIMPNLWNPHDQNGSLGEPRPTDYRIYAESNPPDSPTPPSPISCGAAVSGLGSGGSISLSGGVSSGITLVASTSEILFNSTLVEKELTFSRNSLDFPQR